jgi:hypothetical protein
VKIAFLKGMLVPGAAKPPADAPVQPAVNTAVPSPPAIHPPPNGSVSWNVTYAAGNKTTTTVVVDQTTTMDMVIIIISSIKDAETRSPTVVTT